MKKEKNIFVAVCIILLIALTILLKNAKNFSFEKNEIIYALTVDGIRQDIFPQKGLYKVDTECTNATCKWDYDTWELVIKDNESGEVSCNLTFTSIPKTYLNEYIVNLQTLASVQGNGSVVNEPSTDYRYEGKNPNNYVQFNNELWRIIGVFDTNTHGQLDDSDTITKENQLIKLIRNESIGVLAWDLSGTIDWENSSLYKLLNPVIGDTSSGIYYNKKNESDNKYCYYSYGSPGNCDYSNIGIVEKYRTMIKEVKWYTGESRDLNITIEKVYENERIITESGNNYSKSVQGYIGLMYASDYGYAVLADDCARSLRLNYFATPSNESCAGQNWLGAKGHVYTQTPNSNTGVYYIYEGGFYVNSTNIGNYIIPSLYLDSNVYVLDGDGSYNDPYIIAMDEA